MYASYASNTGGCYTYLDYNAVMGALLVEQAI